MFNYSAFIVALATASLVAASPLTGTAHTKDQLNKHASYEGGKAVHAGYAKPAHAAATSTASKARSPATGYATNGHKSIGYGSQAGSKKPDAPKVGYGHKQSGHTKPEARVKVPVGRPGHGKNSEAAGSKYASKPSSGYKTEAHPAKTPGAQSSHAKKTETKGKATPSHAKKPEAVGHKVAAKPGYGRSTEAHEKNAPSQAGYKRTEAKKASPGHAKKPEAHAGYGGKPTPAQSSYKKPDVHAKYGRKEHTKQEPHTSYNRKPTSHARKEAQSHGSYTKAALPNRKGVKKSEPHTYTPTAPRPHGEKSVSHQAPASKSTKPSSGYGTGARSPQTSHGKKVAAPKPSQIQPKPAYGEKKAVPQPANKSQGKYSPKPAPQPTTAYTPTNTKATAASSTGSGYSQGVKAKGHDAGHQAIPVSKKAERSSYHAVDSIKHGTAARSPANGNTSPNAYTHFPSGSARYSTAAKADAPKKY